MSEKIKIALGEAGGLFSQALAKLTGLNVHSGRDAYALMRTEDQLLPAVRAYRETSLKLLKRHGAHGSLEPLREAMQASGLSPEQRTGLQQRLATLEAAEQFTLTPMDPGYGDYVAQATELASQSVELFLDHRVPVRVEALPDQYFSPAEMRALAPIAEWQFQEPAVSAPAANDEARHE